MSELYVYISTIGSSTHLGPRHQSLTSHHLEFLYGLGYQDPLIQSLGALLPGQVAGVVWMGLLYWAAGVGSLVQAMGVVGWVGWLA